MHEARDDKYLRALEKVRRGKVIRELITRVRVVLFLLLIVTLLLPIDKLPQRLGVYLAAVTYWLLGYLSSKERFERRLNLGFMIAASLLGILGLSIWFLAHRS